MFATWVEAPGVFAEPTTRLSALKRRTLRSGLLWPSRESTGTSSSEKWVSVKASGSSDLSLSRGLFIHSFSRDHLAPSVVPAAGAQQGTNTALPSSRSGQTVNRLTEPNVWVLSGDKCWGRQSRREEVSATGSRGEARPRWLTEG